MTGCMASSSQVEIINAVHDWHDYLAPLHLQVHGVAIMESEEAVNHSFRLVRREDLSSYLVKGAKYDWNIDSAPRTRSPSLQITNKQSLSSHSSPSWASLSNLLPIMMGACVCVRARVHVIV